MHPGAVLGGAPSWVYVLLVVLIVLGVRRLRTREAPVALALVPPVAFLTWSVAGVGSFAAQAGVAVAALAWIGGATFGALSSVALPEPRATRLPGGRVRQPGSPLPVILYLAVFVARFACGAWAAVQPARTAIATAIGIAVGAAMTARLLLALLRWRTA